jgi:hypothetical protein
MFGLLDRATNLNSREVNSRKFEIKIPWLLIRETALRIPSGRPLWSGAVFLLAATGAVWSQEADDSWVGRHHPPQDMALHEKFYSSWHMPDHPATSCCNDADCYPTEIKYVDGNIYAKRREDGKFILVPPEKVERNRDNPDGRNHLCAPPPNFSRTSDMVYCFALGGAT